MMSKSEEIIDRLKDALAVKSDGQLANYLGITRQNIGASRKRDDVPPGWIYKVAELTGYSMDWLSFGRGAKIRMDYSTTDEQHPGQVASPDSPYGSHDIPQRPSDGDLLQDGEGFGTAVEMLARIYSSGDRLLISAIRMNIKAICEAIEIRQRSTKELEDLKKRLVALQHQLPPE
jgi:hypothetical protein